MNIEIPSQLIFLAEICGAVAAAIAVCTYGVRRYTAHHYKIKFQDGRPSVKFKVPRGASDSETTIAAKAAIDKAKAEALAQVERELEMMGERERQRLARQEAKSAGGPRTI